jgi:hypothetical protein
LPQKGIGLVQNTFDVYRVSGSWDCVAHLITLPRSIRSKYWHDSHV